ncbi:MAG TPA: hypothetical protein VKY90_05625 [Candidatus Dormibacteraeota bacterium]|nr:hypothetical protein [Candidatus Dormibacteraeota bacterium]
MTSPASPSEGHGARPEVMALVVWTSASAALGSSLYASRTAALFALLVGIVVVVTLRAATTLGLATAAFGAVLFTVTHLALDTSATPRLAHLELQDVLTQPVLRQGGTWAGVIVAIVVLMGSSLLADVVSAGAARPPEGEPSPAAATTPPILPSRLEGRETGLLKAEQELTRAATYRRPLTLGLIGPDVDQGSSGSGMDALDRLLCDTFTAFDVVCAYGTRERLIVMPEEPSERVAAAAAHLCEVASDRLGCPVRMSVAGFPEDGSTLSELLLRLDQRLLRCRQTRATVSADHASPPEGAEPPGPPAGPSRDATPEDLPPSGASPRPAASPPTTGAGTSGEVEVLDPLELPADVGEPIRGDEVAEELQAVLRDPWSALEAVDEGRGQASDRRPSVAVTRAQESAARRSQPESSTGSTS